MSLTPTRYNVPIKGWNTITPIREMGPEYAPTLENVWFDQSGGMNRRPGQDAVTTTALAANIDSLFEYRDLAGNSILFGWSGSDIYKLTGSTFTKETHINVAGVFTSRPRAAQLAGALIVGDAVSVRTYTTSGGWSISPTGVNPMNMFTVWKGAMIGAGNPIQHMTAYISDTVPGSGVMDWSVPTPGGFIDLAVSLGTGDTITGLTNYLGMLVVFLNNAIVFYSGTSASPAQFKIIRGIGCVNHDSIQGIGNDTIFLSKYGFKKLSEVLVQGDAAAQETSIPINNFIVNEMVRGNISIPSIRSTFAEKFGVYLCTFGNMTLAYHVPFDAWSPWFGLCKTLYTLEDGTVYCADLTIQEITISALGDSIGIAPEFNVTVNWVTAPFRGSSAEVKPRWNRVELIYEANVNEQVRISYWPDLDELSKKTEVIILQPTVVVISPTDGVWSTGASDPRMFWWLSSSPMNWSGGSVSSQFNAGDHRLPIFGRSELLSVQIINDNISPFKITAIETYKNEGGVR